MSSSVQEEYHLPYPLVIIYTILHIESLICAIFLSIGSVRAFLGQSEKNVLLLVLVFMSLSIVGFHISNILNYLAEWIVEYDSSGNFLYRSALGGTACYVLSIVNNFLSLSLFTTTNVSVGHIYSVMYRAQVSNSKSRVTSISRNGAAATATTSVKLVDSQLKYQIQCVLIALGIPLLVTLFHLALTVNRISDPTIILSHPMCMLNAYVYKEFALNAVLYFLSSLHCSYCTYRTVKILIELRKSMKSMTGHTGSIKMDFLYRCVFNAASFAVVGFSHCAMACIFIETGRTWDQVVPFLISFLNSCVGMMGTISYGSSSEIRRHVPVLRPLLDYASVKINEMLGEIEPANATTKHGGRTMGSSIQDDVTV